MVITEAMILGTPAVVTHYLAAHEQIQDGIEGMIVENTEDAIVPALESCIQNPDQVQQMHRYLLQHEYGNLDYMKEIEKRLFEAL